MLTRTLEAREATDISGVGIKPTSLMTKFRDKDTDSDDSVIDIEDSNHAWRDCVAIDTKGNYERFCIEGSQVIGNKVAGASLPDSGN